MVGYERSARSSCSFPLELRRNSEKARKKHSDLPLQASECFVPLLYVPAGGRGRSATNFELQTYSLVCSFTPPMVEVRGVEPLSENLLIQLSPGAEYLLLFLPRAPVLRLARQATVFCVIGSTVNCRCTCTTHLTLSLGSWSYREERVTRRSQHCQLLSPEGSIIRQP